MINVTPAFRKLLSDGDGKFLKFADVMLRDNTVLHLTNSEIWSGGFQFDDAVSTDSEFQVGAAIINKCSIAINNIYHDYGSYDFDGATVVTYIGYQIGDNVERHKRGTYTVDEASYDASLITLECLDNMQKFDKACSSSFISVPATVANIVTACCTQCGVTLDSVTFSHSDFVITTLPDSETTTYREIISWCAQICGCFARCNPDGDLEFKWYDQAKLQSALDVIDGGSFEPWTVGDSLSGGIFNPWTVGDSSDGGDYDSFDDVHFIYRTYNHTVSTDDVIITGVQATIKEDDQQNGNVEKTYTVGTTGYMIDISRNPFIDKTNVNTILGWLGTQLIGFKFRKATISHVQDPTIEAGDIAVLWDRHRNFYPIVVSRTSYTSGSPQTTVSAAQTPVRNSSQRFSAETKNYVELSKNLQRQKTSYEQGIEELTQALDVKAGLYSTIEELQSGNIYYLHDQPDLDDSQIVWKMTAEAFGVTTDYDGDDTIWNGGMTVNGDVIARILTATGVNADWITTGTLSADRIAGNSIDASKLNVTDLSALSGNLGTITAGSINITGTGEGAGTMTLNNGVLTCTNGNFTGTITATSGSFSGTISAGTYLGLPNTGMSVTQDGGLQGTATAGYTGSVLNGSTVGALPVTAAGLSYTSGNDTMSFTTGGLSMGSGIALGVDGTGTISDIKIGKTSIYSEGHTAYSSPVNGFYLGSDGSFGVGNNAGNYLHFDAANGRLDIKVTSFALTGGQTIESIAQNKADAALSSAQTYADGKASTAQSNAESYAYTQATNAFNNAKSYTDTEISKIPSPETLTQQSVFNALTNNGQTQGIFLHKDSDNVTRVYINGAYIASKTIAAGSISVTDLAAINANMGAITAGSINIGSGSKTFSVASDGTFSSTGGSIDGTITARNGYFHGIFQVGELLDAGDIANQRADFYCDVAAYGFKVRNSNGTFTSVSLDGHTHSGYATSDHTHSTFGAVHFNSPWTISGMATVSTNTAMFNIPPNSSVGTIAYGSASSIRYKDVIRDMTEEDVEKAYGIQPVIAKYKDGYLVETDERVGMAYPMFVAEDVEKYLPTVATHRDGLTENWDERAMIPVMFQMIKSLKSEINALKAELSRG